MKQNQQILFLFFICVCTFFVHLDAAFPDLMEMRNFITAREMLSEGNWWFTTLNLEPRLEKPPLPTWLTAWSVMLFGDFDNLYALRLPGAIVATLMVFFFYGFLKEFSTQKYLPLTGALVMATSVLLVQMGRTNSWDIYTHSFMMGSLWQFLVGIKREKKSAIVFSMILMGLSIFSKGPVSLYALWVPYIIALGVSFKGELKKHWGKLLFILLGGLAIGFAWNFYMYLFQPEATEYVLNKETHSWANRHVKSPIFYLNFPIFVGIWIPFLVAFFFYKYAKPKADSAVHYRFVLVWLMVIIVLLSLVPTKKERYILPALVPMCLAVAYMLYGLYQNVMAQVSSKYDQFLLRFFFYLVSIVGLIGPFVLYFIFEDSINTSSIIGLVAVMMVSAGGLYQLMQKQYKMLFIMPVVVVCIVCVFVTPNIIQWSYHYDEFRSLGEIQQNDELKDLPVYTENMFTDPKMCWLVGKPTQLLEKLDLSDSQKFPFVAVTVSTLEVLRSKNELEKINYKYIGKYDFFRKNSKLKANVYLLEWKE